MNRKQKRSIESIAAGGAVGCIAIGAVLFGNQPDIDAYQTQRVYAAQEARPAIPKLRDESCFTKMPIRKKSVAGAEKCKAANMFHDLDYDDKYLLAKIAMAEAEGEDTEGKALVMLVVLNRVRSDEFPDTTEAVIHQKGQFSPVADGRFDRADPDNDCWDSLELVESGWNESQGALYFESKSDSTWHEDNLRFLFQHGGHYFYSENRE